MKEWLEKNEPYLRLAYRLGVLLTLIWLGGLIQRADPGWVLSDIRGWLEFISKQLKK